MFGGISAAALLLGLLMPFVDLDVLSAIGISIAAAVPCLVLGGVWMKFLRRLLRGETWCLLPRGTSVFTASLDREPAVFYASLAFNLMILGAVSGWLMALLDEYMI